MRTGNVFSRVCLSFYSQWGHDAISHLGPPVHAQTCSFGDPPTLYPHEDTPSPGYAPRPVQSCSLCSPYIYWQAGTCPSIEKPSSGFLLTVLSQLALYCNCYDGVQRTISLLDVHYLLLYCNDNVYMILLAF